MLRAVGSTKDFMKGKHMISLYFQKVMMWLGWVGNSGTRMRYSLHFLTSHSSICFKIMKYVLHLYPWFTEQ